MLQIIRDHFYKFLTGDANFFCHYRPCAFLSDVNEQIIRLALVALHTSFQSHDELICYRYDDQKKALLFCKIESRKENFYDDRYSSIQL